MINSPRPEDNPRPPQLGCFTVILSALVFVLAVLLLAVILAGCCPCKNINTNPPQSTTADSTEVGSWWF